MFRIKVQPLRDRLPGLLHDLLETICSCTLFLYCDLLTYAHAVRRNIDFLAIDRDVAMHNKLSCLRAGITDAHAIHDIIESALQQAKACTHPSRHAALQPG